MASAPRDGSAIMLYLRNGQSFVGHYSRKWWGWIDWNEARPLIRGDRVFLGWLPIDDQEGKTSKTS
jgi:hypothetical protein